MPFSKDESGARRLIVPPELGLLDRYHRDPIAAQFGPNPPIVPIDASMRFLFICFTNRCGSNFLARLIGTTGVLNVAEEVFNAPVVEVHAGEQGLRSLCEYVNFICRRLNMNEWLLAKIGIEQLVMLTEAGVLDQVIARSKFILIERQDRVAQAISRLVAIQNRQWTSEHPSAIPDDQLVYTRGAVLAQLGVIDAHNHAFYRFFASNGLAPKHLSYEALLRAPQQHLDEIGAWLGFDGLIGDLSAVRIRRQDSALKRAWKARYEAGQ